MIRSNSLRAALAALVVSLVASPAPAQNTDVRTQPWPAEAIELAEACTI